MAAVAIKSAPGGLQVCESNKSNPFVCIHALAYPEPCSLDPWLWTLTADYGLCFGFGVLVSALHLLDFWYWTGLLDCLNPLRT